MLSDKLSWQFKNTPILGYIPGNRTRFCHKDLFYDDLWKYAILKKIRLWYGTPKSGDENVQYKIILGIQCVYQDTITGNNIPTECHCGDLSNNDVEVKEIEFKENDYLTNFNIDFKYAVTHLKFTTRSGNLFELGEESEFTKRPIECDEEPYMIHSFIGVFDIYGLRALGCKYICRKDYALIHYMGILMLRHAFKIDEKERKKWENPETLNQLPLEMKTIAKLCSLPDDLFVIVMRIIFRIFI